MINYTASGTDADGKDWEVVGILNGSNPLELDAIVHLGRSVFQQLTNGKAQFGQPGVGCRGPYKIKMLTLVAT